MSEYLMKLTRIQLDGYTGFKFSGIQSLTVDIGSPTQIILGSNGCGKSRFLNECRLVPAVRASYSSEGFKSQTIEHRGMVIELTTDFQNSKSPHSFKVDGYEKNVGGTSGAQAELIEQYLGYTPIIDGVITTRFKLTNMAPAARRSLLMSLTPWQMEMVLEEHKKVSKHIRACQNNLTRLYQRKATLEAEFLDPTVADTLKKERQEIETQLEHVLGFLQTCSTKLQMLGDDTSSITFVEIEQEAHRLLKDATRFNAIDRETAASDLEVIINDLATTTGIRSAIIQQTSSLAEEINTLTDQLNSIKSSVESSSGIEQTISHIQKELLLLEGYTLDMDRLVPEGNISLAKHQLDIIREIETLLLDVDNLCSSTAYKQMIEERTSCAFQLIQLRTHQTNLQSQLEDLNKKLTINIEDIPDDCSRARCPLFSMFSSRRNSIISERDACLKSLTETETSIAQLTERQEKLAQETVSYETYLPHIQKLITMISEYGYIRAIVDMSTLRETLNTKKGYIGRSLDSSISVSEKIHRYNHLKRDLQQHLEMKAKVDSLSGSEADLLVAILNEKSNALVRLQSEIGELSSKIQSLTAAKHLHMDYLENVKRLQTLQSLHTDCVTKAVTQYDRKSITLVQTGLQSYKSKLIQRLGEIDRVLRDQDILAARFNSEVMDQISVIEKEKDDYAQLEQALSPTSGIPYKYMTQYINGLIEIMNFCIEMVFSYSLRINPIKAGDTLNYTFSAKADDTDIPDISEFSEAQQEITNLAFTIAVMIQNGWSEYPLFLDETGRTFDPHHKQTLLNLLKYIVDEELVSQLFLVNHNSAVWDGLANSEIIVLHQDNIQTPPTFNDHVTIVH